MPNGPRQARARAPRLWLGLSAAVLAGICVLAPLAVVLAGTRITNLDENRRLLSACVGASRRPNSLVEVTIWHPTGDIRVEPAALIRVHPGMVCTKLPRLRFLPTNWQWRFPT